MTDFSILLQRISCVNLALSEKINKLETISHEIKQMPFQTANEIAAAGGGLLDKLSYEISSLESKNEYLNQIVSRLESIF